MAVKAKRWKYREELELDLESNLDVIISKGDDKGEYISKVLAKAKKGYIIEYPHISGKEPKLKDGDYLVCRITMQKGSFEFKTRVIARQRQPEAFLYVMNPFDVYKIQLRSYVRVDTLINAELAVWDSDSSLDNLDKRPCQITNISGGGAAISTAYSVPPDARILLSFILPGKSEMIDNVSAKVLKCMKVQEDEFKVIVEFEGIKDSDRDMVIHYCFNEQIRLKRKGVAG